MAQAFWPVKTIGEVCEFRNGYAFKSSEYVKKGHALVRIKNVQQGEIVLNDDVFVEIPEDGSLDQFILSAGDILVSLTGYLGRVGRLNKTDLPAALNQRVAKVSIKSKALISDGYLYRLLDSQWFRHQVEIYGRGAAQQNVGTSDISRIKIPVPPLDEQKRIVELLDAATARITELTVCYEQARTHANDLFATSLRDVLAPLEIWPVKRLGDLCLFVRGPFGGSLKKSVFVPTGHAVYEQQHAIHERFIQFRYFVSEEKFQEMKRFEVFPGDILMSCSGTIGKTAIVPSGAPAGIINQALLKLSCLEKLDNQYLCVWMRSSYFQEAVLGSAGGAALQNVASVAILKKIPIALPPLEEQKKIVARLDAMRAKTSEMVAAYDAKLTAAKNLRQSILEAAFAGEL